MPQDYVKYKTFEESNKRTMWNTKRFDSDFDIELCEKGYLPGEFLDEEAIFICENLKEIE